MSIKSMKSVKMSAIFNFFVSESGETYHTCITGRIILSARKSRVIISSDLELEHFEGQGENFALLVKLMG